MPLARYQIRNEFNLADPELYRAAEKDDPEALLEGVAMAGLVGLLRQLGDLAEFAAEIFHDLHEEAMATAARGHGLIARIQQLEADVPLIEKNLLSQTNHTTFYYNTGVDWHPQMCTNQNLITQGDMPRFIRDSYEECRGPPQLFLLDKFDIGGAGACLKRYTDPSSFKVDPTAPDAAKIGVQRDRRTRKNKKKGSHWRNGGTPEVLTTSHAKLHQLLLEERIGNDSKDPTRHVKLKKRVLDGSKRTKSYMGKFLQTMSPEHSETDEIETGQPILRLTYGQTDASEREILDIQPVSAADDSLYFSHTGQETKLRPSVMYSYDFSKSRRNRGSTVSIEDGNSIGTASPRRTPVTEKEFGVDGNNRNVNGTSSPYYDAIANETENFVDALANMESEAETDNEYIPKKELRYLSKHAGVYDSKEQVLDSQSVDNSMISDDGSISFVKGTSTSSSYGVPPNEEHGNREAESSISMKTYEAVIVDYSDSLDYDKTEKITSRRCLNGNGESVGSLVTPYNYEIKDVSFQKDSSHLLQSSDSGLTSRQLTPAGAYYYMAPSEVIYDSELPQPGRNRVNGGGVVATPDGLCMVDNARASIERHESNDPLEILTHGPIDFSHDQSKLSSTIENETLLKGHVNEFSSETSASEEVVSPQSAIDTKLHEFELPYQDRDISSHVISTPNGTSDCYHDTVSNDDDARSATGESFDGFTHVMKTTEENIGNNASVLLVGHSYDDGSLYNTKTERAATNSLSETGDTEGRVSSEELLSHRVLVDDVALETDSGSNCDYGQAVSPMSIYLPPGNRNDDVDVIRQSDSFTQKVGNLQTETEVKSEGAPPLPPLPPTQWMVGKPRDSFLDDEGRSVEFSMASNPNGSLPPAFGLNSSLHFTPLNGEIKHVKATETDESLPSTSRHCLNGFPSPTDSILHIKDAIEENGQLSLPTSDKLKTDSSSIHPRIHLESGQPDTFAFASETPAPSSVLCLPHSSTSTDAVTLDVQSSESAELSVPLSGDMPADAKENIQPRHAEHAVLSARESAQSCTTWESPQSSLGDTVVSKFSTSEVPMLFTNQSPEESSSYSRTEHGTQGHEEEIIKHPDMRGPLIKDEERRKQEIKSAERQASWSLALQNYEGEKLAEKPAFKLPRPRNPLIQSADALDRSKLKKVTTLNRPKAPTFDERGSILEQIRAKSFNLKPAPAPVPKPIIQAPSMNLKVAAILEKANKIRRATTGSDEDDEDDWSDD